MVSPITRLNPQLSLMVPQGQSSRAGELSRSNLCPHSPNMAFCAPFPDHPHRQAGELRPSPLRAGCPSPGKKAEGYPCIAPRCAGPASMKTGNSARLQGSTSSRGTLPSARTLCTCGPLGPHLPRLLPSLVTRRSTVPHFRAGSSTWPKGRVMGGGECWPQLPTHGPILKTEIRGPDAQATSNTVTTSHTSMWCCDSEVPHTAG